MLRGLPQLPMTPALAQANSILAAARGRPHLEEQMRLLLEPLQSQSLGVRSMALQVNLHPFQGLRAGAACRTSNLVRIDLPCCWSAAGAAQELRTFMLRHQSWLVSTQTSSLVSANAAGEAQSSQLLSMMISALLKCCDTEVQY